MKMEEAGNGEYIDNYNSSEAKLRREKQKKRDDLISKKLGELLLQGYKMLNETCSECECILMQRRNEDKYCVGCQDRDVVALSETKREEPPKQMEVSSSFITDPISITKTQGSVPVTNVVVSSDSLNAVNTLKMKINWAAEELKSSNNIRYNIELCEMIKAASEALNSLQKL